MLKIIEGEGLPKNIDIYNSAIVTKSKLDNVNYEKVMCSVSGGSDSDILIDLVWRIDKDKKVEYVFYDTGLEYEATKKQLEYLEIKYGIKIKIEKAIKSIPRCCKEYGQPFLSKRVSDYISRLQRHNFKWEDRAFKELYEEYPKCKVALRWWCNDWGEGSKFNISYNKYLKEFMVSNKPKFLISEKCCKYAKKLVASNYAQKNGISLKMIGVRKAEGGARATAYKNCFTVYEDAVDEFRPIFWYKNETKRDYENYYNIKHSKCYTEYGLKRTGCAGCPYGKEFEFEIEVIKEHEPKLHKAIMNIFKESYEYTRAYKNFVNQKANEKSDLLLKEGDSIKRYKQLEIFQKL